MTNELEKQFFDTFGIKPKIRFHCANSQPCAHTGFHCKGCTYHSKDVIYPQITDRILLELICILNSVSVELKSECIKDLKQEILGEMKILLEYAPNEETEEFIKQQVQALFEEV